MSEGFEPADLSPASRNHHYNHPVMSHDWSFLEGDKRHTHTLKAGHHSFPFSLMLDGNLPSTLHTYTSDAVIGYKLRADVVRSGFASNFHDTKPFTLTRTYTPEALEFNQTLEIENTWPGKVMYALTIPFKAYAAGDDIPVSVKFMPLAKGVKVLSILSVVKEYTRVHTRHSSHADARVAMSIRHEFRNGQAVTASEEPLRQPLHYEPSRRSSLVTSAPSVTPRPNGPAAGPAACPSSSTGDLIGDDEIDTSFTIPIPPWITASHSVHPVFITHKIKWSCSISNPDGHISELRCALGVNILDHSLLEEARASGASSRGLLFGGASAEEALQVDLPSYTNHVYDRVAVADSSNTAFISRQGTPQPSPHDVTPPDAPSRPVSPTGISEPDDVPPRRQLSSWADSELLYSLGSRSSNGSSPHDTPPVSRGPSRPLSRRNSRSGRNSAGSRGGSRASSPERGADEHRAGFIMNHLSTSFKPMLSGKPILRNSSGAALNGHADLPQRNAVSFTNLPERRASHEHGRRRFHLGGADTPEPEADPINRVPSYAIASRGFLGGGVVPLDGGPPMYNDSESIVERTGSETNLDRRRSETGLTALGER